MVNAVNRMLGVLKRKARGLPEVDGYAEGKFVGDKEDVCIRMLLGEELPGYGYYTGVWDIRKPDGSELYEAIPEARGMREANII